MRFDHLLHWVPGREAAVNAYRSAGLHVTVGGEHPWGTHNALVHFGLPYIEIIAYHDKSRAHSGPASILSPGEMLLTRGGGSRNFAVAVADLAAAAAALRIRDVVVGEPEPGSRRQPDGTTLYWKTAAILSGPVWRPFLIEWGQADPERLADLRARGIDAPHPVCPLRIRELVIATTDPAGEAAWGERLLGRPADGHGHVWRLPLPECELVLVGAQEAGIAASEAPRIVRLVLESKTPGIDINTPATARKLEIFGLDIVIRGWEK
ncbi:MAG: VOC family protein [Bacteroidota bacterium]